MRPVIKIEQAIFILLFIIFTYFPLNDVANLYLQVTWIEKIISNFDQVIWLQLIYRVLLSMLQNHIWKLINIRSCYHFKFFFVWGRTLATTFNVFYFLVSLWTFEFIIALSHSRKMRWQTNLFDVNRFLLDLI